MMIDILGQKYSIAYRDYDKDETFDRMKVTGYCNRFLKVIVVCRLATHPLFEYEPTSIRETVEKEIVRHEIIHAFLSESGLASSANPSPTAWSENEEMIDWFAIQGPKIYAAWVEAKAV